jgi:hypothetical protein
VQLRNIGRRAAIAAAATIAAGGLALGVAGAASAAPLPFPTADHLTLTYGGGTYTYTVNLHEQFVAPGEELITGTLRDTYEPHPLTLPVFGVQSGRVVVFSVSYPVFGPDAGSQGVRTFSGTEGVFGKVAGLWSETGSEGGAGTFTLARI